MDDYKDLAESLGLKFETICLKEGRECSVEGRTDKVIAFRDESGTYGTGWYDLSPITSCYVFLV